jgi:hypothetical protein
LVCCDAESHPSFDSGLPRKAVIEPAVIAELREQLLAQERELS